MVNGGTGQNALHYAKPKWDFVQGNLSVKEDYVKKKKQVRAPFFKLPSKIGV